MAKTREQIKVAVGYNTGRATEKDEFIDSMCNEALDVALREHPFRDAQSTDSISITEGDVSVNLSSITDLTDIISARILETGSNAYRPLILRDRVWWDRHVVDPASNMQGWPSFGLWFGDLMYFERPVQSGLTLHLVFVASQQFDSDSTVNPIPILDTFIVQYVTAMVFQAIQDMNAAILWSNRALGPRWDEGRVGGSLLHAIQKDKYHAAEEMHFDTGSIDGSGGLLSGLGVGVHNKIRYIDDFGGVSYHDDYGNIRIWY